MPIQTFVGNGSWVKKALFSPDGRQVLTGSDDGFVRLWDVHPILSANPDEQIRLACEQVLSMGIMEIAEDVIMRYSYLQEENAFNPC